MGRSGLYFATLFILVALGFGLGLGLVAPPAASAQDRYRHAEPARWDQPVVEQTTLDVRGKGSLDGDTLYLPAGEHVAIEAQATDQNGRPFPQDRFRFGFDLDSSCRGLVELVNFEHGTINLRTGNRTGTCSVLFWVPNNMNLDRTLQIDVGTGRRPSVAPNPQNPGFRPPGARPRGDGEVAESRDERVAASLFRAVLGREPDGRWLADGADQVRRGHTRDLIASLLDGPEFRQRRSRLSPDEILTSFYRGLLGRDPDPSGRQTYIDDINKGRYEVVILDLLGSQEYNQRMANGGARPRNR